jgi:hypothetical protein
MSKVSHSTLSVAVTQQLRPSPTVAARNPLQLLLLTLGSSNEALRLNQRGFSSLPETLRLSQRGFPSPGEMYKHSPLLVTPRLNRWASLSPDETLNP